MIKKRKIGRIKLGHLALMLLVLCGTTIFAQNDPNLPFPINNPLNPGQNLPQSFDLGDKKSFNVIPAT
jgi:hypothetical protein